jgi:hypothetical protein
VCANMFYLFFQATMSYCYSNLKIVKIWINYCQFFLKLLSNLVSNMFYINKMILLKFK